MAMLVAISLAFLITVSARFLNRTLRLEICPICLGVSSTWLIISLLIVLGIFDEEAYLLPLGLLIGGTVVGIAFQGEKKYVFARQSIWRWKLPVIFIGLTISYLFLINLSPLVLILEALLLLGFGYFLFGRREKVASSKNESVKKIKEEMENCC
ncbi:MAG: hypothetical protein HYW37_00940 [Candidatus Colwellbacteria bacterium]|nr:hypothetical protein [Candidatus Colwellbacteria bacterium]